MDVLSVLILRLLSEMLLEMNHREHLEDVEAGREGGPALDGLVRASGAQF